MPEQSAARPLRVCLIATEESGDRLGASLMDHLARETAGAVEFSGVGGRAMTDRGLASWFPVDDMGIFGFTSIPRRLPKLLARIRDAAGRIVAHGPDILVIIDSPDFNHRVARKVRQRAPSIPIVDYVSPSVWAWRPGRAPAMRHYVDLILGLLPFEPEVHRRLGGPHCVYVGHPLLERRATLRAPGGQRPPATDGATVLVLPGSRRSELARHLPVYRETLERVNAAMPGLDYVMPVPPHLADIARAAVHDWPAPVCVLDNEADKAAAFRAASGALAKSGTVTLELALAQIPTVACYRVPAIEGFVARRLIRANTVILANLVLGENVVPEFLQEACRADRLAPALLDILAETPARAKQQAAFARLDAIMDTGQAPGKRAARAVLDLLAAPAISPGNEKAALPT